MKMIVKKHKKILEPKKMKRLKLKLMFNKTSRPRRKKLQSLRRLLQSQHLSQHPSQLQNQLPRRLLQNQLQSQRLQKLRQKLLQKKL
jgi:hypothetical protein